MQRRWKISFASVVDPLSLTLHRSANIQLDNYGVIILNDCCDIFFRPITSSSQRSRLSRRCLHNLRRA